MKHSLLALVTECGGKQTSSVKETAGIRASYLGTIASTAALVKALTRQGYTRKAYPATRTRPAYTYWYSRQGGIRLTLQPDYSFTYDAVPLK